MRIDVWLGFPAEARPDGVRLPEISNGSCVPGDVRPEVLCYAFTTLIVGHVCGLSLVVGPVSMAVCALGLWYGL